MVLNGFELFWVGVLNLREFPLNGILFFSGELRQRLAGSKSKFKVIRYDKKSMSYDAYGAYVVSWYCEIALYALCVLSEIFHPQYFCLVIFISKIGETSRILRIIRIRKIWKIVSLWKTERTVNLF